MLTQGTIVKTDRDVRSHQDQRRKVDRHTLAYFDMATADGHGQPHEYRVSIELPRGWLCQTCHGEAYVSLGTQPTVYVPDACENTLRLYAEVKRVVTAEQDSRKAMRSYRG